MADPLRSGAIFRIANPQALKSPLPYHIFLQRQQQQQQQGQPPVNSGLPSHGASPTAIGSTLARPQPVYAKLMAPVATSQGTLSSRAGAHADSGAQALFKLPMAPASAAGALVNRRAAQTTIAAAATANVTATMPSAVARPRTTLEANGSTEDTAFDIDEFIHVDKYRAGSSAAKEQSAGESSRASTTTSANDRDDRVTKGPHDTDDGDAAFRRTDNSIYALVSTEDVCNPNPVEDGSDEDAVSAVEQLLTPRKLMGNDGHQRQSASPSKLTSASDNECEDTTRDEKDSVAEGDEDSMVEDDEDSMAEDDKDSMAEDDKDSMAEGEEESANGKDHDGECETDHCDDEYATNNEARHANKGRPPVAADDNVDDNRTNDADADPSVSADGGDSDEDAVTQEEPMAPPVKRKRGRPRKSDVSSNDVKNATLKAKRAAPLPATASASASWRIKRRESVTIDRDFIRTHAGVHFDTWWLRDQPGVLPVVVEGVRVLENGNKQMWHSSLIASRLDSWTLKSGSGNTYYLHGPLNVSGMMSNQFSQSVIDIFENGFPLNWEEVLRARKESNHDDKLETAKLNLLNAKRPNSKKMASKNKYSNESENVAKAVEGPSDETAAKTTHTPVAAGNAPRKSLHPATGSSSRSRRLSGVTPETSFKYEWGTGRLKPVPVNHLATIRDVDNEGTASTTSRPHAHKNAHSEKVAASNASTAVSAQPKQSRGRSRKRPISAAAEGSLKSAPVPSYDDGSDDEVEWNEQEDRILRRELCAKDPKASNFWVAESLPGKTEKQCQRRFESDFKSKPVTRRTTSNAAVKTTGGVLAAGKKTLARKRHLRAIIQERNDNHAGDDLFQGENERPKPDHGDESAMGFTASRAGKRQKLLDPGAPTKYTPMRPSTKQTTSRRASQIIEESPEILKPFKATTNDAYIRNLQRVGSARGSAANTTAAKTAGSVNMKHHLTDRAVEGMFAQERERVNTERLVGGRGDEEDDEDEVNEDVAYTTSAIAAGLRYYVDEEED